MNFLKHYPYVKNKFQKVQFVHLKKKNSCKGYILGLKSHDDNLN